MWHSKIYKGDELCVEKTDASFKKGDRIKVTNKEGNVFEVENGRNGLRREVHDVYLRDITRLCK